MKSEEKGSKREKRLINETGCPPDILHAAQKEKFHRKKFEAHSSLNSFALTELKFQMFPKQQMRGKRAQRKTNV